jgi:phosphohistidine phosphatase
MLVGHNPAMSWFASELSGTRIDNMPTCAVVAVEIDTAKWREAGTRPARLLDFDYPKKPC